MKTCYKLILAFGIIATVIHTASAQAPAVIDIRPGTAGSNPHYLTSVNFSGSGPGYVYYIADDGIHGNELHRIDSTLRDSMIVDLNPNGDGVDYSQSKDMAFSFNNSRVLYLGANNGTSGNKLFYYSPVYYASPIQGSSFNLVSGYIGDMLATGGSLYFTRKDVSGGYTYNINSLSGPQTLRKFGVAGGGNEPWGYTFYGSRVMVTEQTSTAGRELFEVKSSPDTLVPIADIEPGPGSANPFALTQSGSKLYFFATTTADGRELYSYDGTNVTRVTTTAAPVNSACVDSTAMVAFGGNVYFHGQHPITGRNGLFRYNTTSGAVEVIDTATDYDSYSMRTMYNWGDRLFYNRHFSGANQLWMYDGNAASMVADFGPGVSTGAGIRQMIAYDNNRLLLIAEDAAHGSELFAYTVPPLGVKTASFNGELSLAPNPVQQDCRFTLTLKQDMQLELRLTNMAGRMVYTTGKASYHSGKQEVIIPMHGFAAGIYSYTLQGSNGAQLAAGKLIKK